MIKIEIWVMIGGLTDTGNYPRFKSGYNIDGLGALMVLEETVGEIRGKNVLILGAGGAARAISFYLDASGAMVTLANRIVDVVKRLVYQGATSFNLWTKEDPPVEVMENAVTATLIR